MGREREAPLRAVEPKARALSPRDHQHGDASVAIGLLARRAKGVGAAGALGECHDVRQLDRVEAWALGRLRQRLPVDASQPDQEPLADVGPQLRDAFEEMLLLVLGEQSLDRVGHQMRRRSRYAANLVSGNEITKKTTAIAP
jgi:hypothetical protein